MSKPKVGFNWLASCGGCEEAVVDLNEGILTVVEAVDIVFWPCAMDFKKDDVEKMDDGEIDVCFVNGAIRTSEEEHVSKLLRKKSKVIVAFGSCSHTGGIPGLGNLKTREEIMDEAYLNGMSTVNPDKVYPQSEFEAPEGKLELPVFLENVRCLNQVIDVDYYLPGCPPPANLIMNAITAILEGKLPPKGSVLAPDKAMCEECERKDTKPDNMLVKELKRPHEMIADPEKCLLAQGLLCLGPVTRAGCGAVCVKGNMPCTGCMGPTSRVRDYGAKALSAIASIVDQQEEDEIEKVLATVVDPEGTFYRYSVPASLLHRRLTNV
ncbi:MAG: oxidoreductase [bacterium]|jgi:F420-non-reducing hydrogenase small subunit|nr:oxidoreductase [bacterium]